MIEYDYKDAEIIRRYEEALSNCEKRVMAECKRLGFTRDQTQKELYTNIHLTEVRKALCDHIATRTTIKYIL